MNIHKNTCLTPYQRQAVWCAYTQDKTTITSLVRQYQFSRVTGSRILKAARLQVLAPQKSTNNRFKQAKHGMKCLAKVKKAIRGNSKGRPNATTNSFLTKWRIPIPNGCLCCRIKKQQI